MDARQVRTRGHSGSRHVGYGGATNPYHTSAPILQQAFTDHKGLVTRRLMTQTHLSDLYGELPLPGTRRRAWGD